MSRKTQQRKWIRHVFDNTKRPLTPQEVLDLAQTHVEGLGIATVYRNLKAFHDEGLLRTVELPNEPTRYELADLDHHHHFHCESCGRVFDVPGCVGDVNTLAPDGFQVRRHEILLYGICGGCD